jgi:hypothetical protein
MGRDWIIDVLADLRSFARENDMPLLMAHLEEAGLVAAVEIASHPEEQLHRIPNEDEIGSGIPTRLDASRRP